MWFYKSKMGKPVTAVIANEHYDSLHENLKTRFNPAPDDAKATHEPEINSDGVLYLIDQEMDRNVNIGTPDEPTENYVKYVIETCTDQETEQDFGGGDGGGAGAGDTF
jgi:hypothetical protein